MVARILRSLPAWSIASLIVAGASSSPIASAQPGTPVFEAAGYGVVRPWFESYQVLALATRPADAGGPAEISTISTMPALLRVERWAVSDQGVPYLSGFVPTQYRPTAMTWADVDGDGAADLLCGETTSTGTALEVMLMGPSGPVAPGQLFTLHPFLSAPVRFVTSSDVNADGFVDIGVVGSSGDGINGRMNWVLGGPSGMTVGPVSEAHLARPAISRLDADVTPDLVNWEPASQFVSFAHGNGDGTFSPLGIQDEASGPPHFADLDADGREDFVAGRFVYRGDASGIPMKQDSLAANVSTLVDLDHDGRGDLVAVEEGRIRVSRGLGGFGFAPFSDLRCGSIDDRFSLFQRFGLSGVVDVTGDTWADVIGTSAASFGRVLYVVPGRIGGAFTGPHRFPTGSQPAQVELADVIGSDGHPDMVVLARGAARLEVRPGSGDGAFGPAQLHPLPAGGRRFAVADLDDDGHLDAAVVCDTTNAMSIYRGTGSGLGSRTDHSTDAPLSDLQIADVDEDGTLDVLAMTVSGQLRGWKGTGGLSFSAAPWSAWTQGDGRLRLADFDDDGHLDLVTVQAGSFPGGIRLLQGDGQGSFTQGQPPFQSSYSGNGNHQIWNGTVLDCGDLLGDGGTFVAFVGADSMATHHAFFRGFRGDASGFHTIPEHCDFGTCWLRDGYEVAPQPRQLAIGDVTGDGLPDAITLSGVGGVLTVVPGLGGGQFDIPIAHVVGADPSSFALGDVNGDGRPDAAVANAGSNDVIVLRNRAGNTLDVPRPTSPSQLRVRIASTPSATTVRFQIQLAEQGEARLEIFDAQGRRLHDRRLEATPAREREVAVDGRALPQPGILFARLSQNGVAASAAFVRLR